MRKNIFKKEKVYSLLMLLGFIFFLLSGVSIKNTVLALTGDYNRVVSGDNQIDTADWDNLDNDFVAKSGDVMQGDLSMGGKKITNLIDPVNGGDAVNKNSLDNAISAIATAGSANIKNISGENLKMVCGTTPIGSTVWLNGGANTITTTVDTSSAGFTDNNVIYFASLAGDMGMFSAVGQNAIYKPISGNYREGFRIYLINNDLSLYNAASATSPWNWHIRWCGIGK